MAKAKEGVIHRVFNSSAKTPACMFIDPSKSAQAAADHQRQQEILVHEEMWKDTVEPVAS